MIQTRLLSSVSVSACLQRKGIVKLGHLLNRDGWKSLEELKEMTGLRSSRLTEKLMEGIVNTLPSSYRKYIGRGTLMDMTNEQELPGIKISYLIKTENEDEDVGSILSFKTPQLEYFESASKKAIYHSTVKVLHQDSLKGQKASRWPGLLKPDFLVRDRWRALYKPPIEKRTADLQWRLIHGAIATDRHVAHLNPAVSEQCRFCGMVEDLEHLFLRCNRLKGLFNLLDRWFRAFDEKFLEEVFIGGVMYRFSIKRKACLLNYLIGTAKLAIWKTRKNKGLNLLTIDAELMFKNLVAGRLKIEFLYYNLIKNEGCFDDIWCLKNVLCEILEGQLVLNF